MVGPGFAKKSPSAKDGARCKPPPSPPVLNVDSIGSAPGLAKKKPLFVLLVWGLFLSTLCPGGVGEPPVLRVAGKGAFFSQTPELICNVFCSVEYVVTPSGLRCHAADVASLVRKIAGEELNAEPAGSAAGPATGGPAGFRVPFREA